MKKNYIIITIAILFVLSIIFFVKPFFRRNDAINIVKTVLKYWKSDDITSALPYWEKQEESPPVYDLSDYTIENGEVTKKDGVYSAQVYAVLDFPPSNPFPSGKKWAFHLIKTRYGWKITDFVLSENE